MLITGRSSCGFLSESSSVMVKVASERVRPVAVPERVSVSFPSSKASCVGVKVKVVCPPDHPAPMVMSKFATAA